MTDELSSLLRQIFTQHKTRSNEGQWIIDHLSSPEMKEAAAASSMLGFHILATLDNQALTGIELADKLGSTRGGVTRAAQTLLQYGLITSHQKSENQRKIYYQLTDKGREMNTVHAEMHRQLDDTRERELYSHYTAAEKALVARFLRDALKVEQGVESDQRSFQSTNNALRSKATEEQL